MKKNFVVLRRSRRISDKLANIPLPGELAGRRVKPVPKSTIPVKRVSFNAPDNSTSTSESSNSTFAVSSLSSAPADRPTKYTCVSVGDVLSLGLRIVKQLGHGTYGTVYRVIDEKHKSVLALKVAHSKLGKVGSRCREEQIYAIIHSHQDTAKCMFLEFYASFEFNERRCILLEHCAMSLRDLQTKEHIFPLPTCHIQHIAVQLILGLDYLHRLELIHCDVKPENILLCKGDTCLVSEPNRRGIFVNKQILSGMRVKIGDLGGTITFSEAGTGTVGSNSYRAPEVTMGITWDHTTDTFALGCVLAELYLQRPLFGVEKDPIRKLAMIEAILGLFPSDLAMQACQEHADLFKKTAGNVWRVNYPPISNDLESDTDVRTTNEIALLPSLQELIECHALRRLVEEMLHVDFAQRISLDLALDHYFFQGMA